MYIFFNRLSKPAGRVGNYTSPGSDRWTRGWGGPGDRPSQVCTMEPNHMSRSPNQLPETKEVSCGKVFLKWEVIVEAGPSHSRAMILIGRMFYNAICPTWVGCVRKIILPAPGMIFFEPKKPSYAWKKHWNLAWSLLNCRGLIRTCRQSWKCVTVCYQGPWAGGWGWGSPGQGAV